MGHSSNFNTSLISFVVGLSVAAARTNRVDLELAAHHLEETKYLLLDIFPANQAWVKRLQRGETVDDVVRKIKWARPGLRWQG